jgi:hypothetical protein
LATAEIFDPAANGGQGSFSPTGDMGFHRFDATATLLPNGLVLIAGGMDPQRGGLARAELFDPSANGGSGAFSSTVSVVALRERAMATLLPNGAVLIAGGIGGSILASAELFDPDANGGLGAFTATASMNVARTFGTATLLSSGKVLIVGGQIPFGIGVERSAELYLPK